MSNAPDYCVQGEEARVDGAGGPFQHIPVYNRGGVGNCYAYAAAQLLDYQRIQQAQSAGNFDAANFSPTSPFYVSLQTRLKMHETASSARRQSEMYLSSVEGGQVSTALNAIAANGSCTADGVRLGLLHSGLSSLMRTERIPSHVETNGDFDYMILRLLDIYDERKCIDNDVQKATEAVVYLTELLNRGSLSPEFRQCVHGRRNNLQGLRMFATSGEIDSYLRSCSSFDYIDKLKSTLDTVACRPRPGHITASISTIVHQNAGISSFSLIKSVKDALTNSSRRPVAIQFCGAIMTQTRQEGLANSFVRYDPSIRHVPHSSSVGCQSHSAVVTGMRWNAAEGRCQVLIRESNGATCDQYCHVVRTIVNHRTETSHEFSDDRVFVTRQTDRTDAAPPLAEPCPLEKKTWHDCSQGSVWVDADVLNKNLLSVVEISP